MISIERYDDVTRIRMSSFGSRTAGMDVSAYVVRGVMIDSGFPHVGGELARALDDLSRDGLRLEGVILTHWHEDHSGNATLLAERGLPIQVAEATLATLRERPRIRQYRRFAWGRPLAFTARHTPFSHAALGFLAAPGHSADHHVVWDAERATLFSGDLWLGVRSRVMHESEDPRLILDSLRRVIALEPARMFDAHRGLVTDATGALKAKAEWLAETIGTIEAKLAAGWSRRAIVREVLGGEEASAFFSRGEYARANFVRALGRR